MAEPALYARMELRIKEFEKQLQKAQRAANDNFSKVEKRGKQMGRRLESDIGRSVSKVGGLFKSFGGGLLAGVAAGGAAGIVASLRQVAGSVAAIGDEAKRAGVTTRVFQEWAAVAQQARIPVDALTDGLKELSLRGDEFAVTGKGSAAEAFERLGYSAAELKTKLQDPSALLLEIIDRLGKFDKAAQLRISDELFGGQAAERFGVLIDQGAAGIRETIDQAHRLGNVLSDEVVQRAAEIDRQFNIVSRTVGTALKGAIVEAAIALQDFISEFNGFDAQRSARLDENLAALGKERLDIERQIFELRARTDGMAGDGLLGTSIGDSGQQGAIADHERRLEAIQAEEAAILKVLEARRKASEVPAATGGGFTPAPYVPPPAEKDKTPAVRADEYDRLANSIANATASLVQETELQRQMNPLVDDFGYAIERARLQQDLMNAAIEAGKEVTPGLRSEISALADQYSRASVEAQQLAVSQEQARATAEQFGDIAQNTVGTFVGDLERGVDVMDALKNSAAQLAAELLQMAINAAIKKLVEMLTQALGGFSGGGYASGFPSAPSGGGASSGVGLYASGGYTGAGGKYQPAGVVHKGEYVLNQKATRRLGVPTLDAMNSGRMPRAMPDVADVPRMPNIGAIEPRAAAPSPMVLNIDARGAQPGVGAEIEAAGKKIIEQVRKEFPINTAKALKTIKRMGYNQ